MLGLPFTSYLRQREPFPARAKAYLAADIRCTKEAASYGKQAKKPWSVPAFARAGTRAADPPRPEAEDFPKHTSRVLGGGLPGEVRGGAHCSCRVHLAAWRKIW